jgi:peptidoglycan/LPS O-acetylase OafA/YrhL
VTSRLSSNQYHPFVDGLRAVSILGVLIAHTSFFFDTNQLSGFIFKSITILGPYGHLGVDLFFVTSGFLITGILIKTFAAQINLKLFYQRRFWKIYPQYALVVICGLLILPLGLNTALDTISRPLSYINYFFFLQTDFQVIAPLSHLWSIAVESHFYILYPLIVYAIFYFIQDESRRRRVLIQVCTLIILLINFNREIFCVQEMLLPHLHPETAGQTTMYRIDAIFLGCLIKLWEPDMALFFLFNALNRTVYLLLFPYNNESQWNDFCKPQTFFGKCCCQLYIFISLP